MLTLKLFDALVSPRVSGMTESELKTWARIEYKNDADFAYHYMKEHGKMPNVGSLRHV